MAALADLSDIAAQVAANQRGVNELTQMIARYGIEVVHSYMRHIQDAAERKLRAAIRKREREHLEFFVAESDLLAEFDSLLVFDVIGFRPGGAARTACVVR
mgnify:CR=1 FL=1